MAVSVPPPEQTSGKRPPQNQEAEVSVLGSILLSEQALDGILIDVKLRPDDFYRPRHGVIFGAMIRLKEKAEPEPVDVLTVSDELDRTGQLEEVGGREYVHSLPNLVPAAANARQYARIVKEYALLRRLLDTTRGIQEDVFGFAGAPHELLEKAEAQLYRIAHDDRTGELRSIEAILHDELAKLERVSREGVAITGTPSGFKDIDDLTGGFQPGNLIVLAARPAMGKCLPGSALIYDPTTGRRRRMDEIVDAHERGEEVWVASMGYGFTLHSARVSLVARNGCKPVFRLTTRLGRQVEATANHPVLTFQGWRRIDELAPGDRIAVPRALPRVGGRPSMPDHELVLLAALIADGNLTQNSPRFCYGEDSAILPEVECAVAKFGLRLSNASHGTATISGGRGAPSNPVRDLFEHHGLWGRRSDTKFVPSAVFELDEEQIARFLSVLYGCDGHVYVSKRLGQVGYTTISERLARDVQHLLLRLGIVGKIRTLRRPVYDGTDKVAREVIITGQESLARFCERVQVVGKEAKLARLAARLETAMRATNRDTIPSEIWERVTAVKGARSWSELSLATGRPVNHNWHVGVRGVSRPLLGEIANWSGDGQLLDLAGSDIWWDEITSIEPAGFEETYDLRVPDGRNFVADDIVVHNSALVTNIAQNAAVDHERAVALFSLEMSETELAQRFIAAEAKLNGDDLRKGRVRPDRWPKVVKATEKLHAAPLYIDDSSDLGVMEMRAKARRLHARESLGLVVVDYLQLMRPEPGTESRVEQIGQISRGLKLLARELNIPVIAVSQLSRAVEQRPDKRPLLSDLRESGCLTGDSLVYLPDEGRHCPIRDLDGTSGFKVLAVDTKTWKAEPRTAKGFRTGRKPVFRITTNLGRTLRATANHRLLTVAGWRRLDELEDNEHVAILLNPVEDRTSPSEPQAVHLASARVATLVRMPELDGLATSDVYWDKIRSIEQEGVEDVYDLTVDGLHNFVANGLVVHNSIEQDADLVMFIYRDEYYNKESERPGEADIIVAKHRNGPIGDVTLTFLSRYPKFANIYRPPPGASGPPPPSGNGGGNGAGNGGGDLPPRDIPPPAPPANGGSEDDPW